MTYLAFVLRRAIIIAASAALGAVALVCVLLVALHTRSTDVRREPLTASWPAAAGAIMPVPSKHTPGPGRGFVVLLVLCVALLFAMMAFLAPHHLHLRHGGQAVHSKSL